MNILASRLRGDTGCFGAFVSGTRREIQNGAYRWRICLLNGRGMPGLGWYR